MAFEIGCVFQGFERQESLLLFRSAAELHPGLGQSRRSRRDVRLSIGMALDSIRSHSEDQIRRQSLQSYKIPFTHLGAASGEENEGMSE